jgi:hypothetical protein
MPRENREGEIPVLAPLGRIEVLKHRPDSRRSLHEAGLRDDLIGRDPILGLHPLERVTVSASRAT